MLFSCLSIAAQACDICGCGAGSNYLGILPDFNSKIAGIRYRFNEVMAHVGPGGASSFLTTQGRYYTAELWAGWTFGNKVRVMAYVPLSYNTKSNEEEGLSKAGPGDAGLQAFYRVINTKNTISQKLLVQDLWIGGGVKLPTGKYEPKDKETSGQSANLFQLGTGSFDFMATAMYDIRLQDAGLSLTASYKMNMTNKYDYNYGNKLSANAQLYYKFKVGKALTVSPNAGAAYETSQTDLDQQYPVYNSGGYILFGTIGTEMNYRKIAFGGNWQPPLKQDLAMGLVKAHHKMMLHVALMF